MPVSAKFIKTYKYLCIEVFFLIAFGGFVRTMNAGLACPDWPLCFGDVIPDYHPQVYFEFIHRVLAGIVAIFVVVLNTKLLRNKQVSKSVKVLSIISFIILITQIIMGGLTVLMLLNAYIVTVHLALGAGLFACLLWIYFSISEHKTEKVEVTPSFKLVSVFVLLVIFAQMILGGLVASNYAGLVCVDFPLCNGKLIPTFHGVIGLQVIHRLGAYFTFAVIVGFFALALVTQKNITIKKWTTSLLILVLLQMALGIANILLKTPPIISVLHLAIATAMLGQALRILKS